MEHLSTQPEQEPTPELYGKAAAQWHSELTGDDLDVPASRYGRTAGEVAWWPVAVMYAFDRYADAPFEPEHFAESLMGQAVNDSDNIEEFALENKESIPRAVWDELRLHGETPS